MDTQDIQRGKTMKSKFGVAITPLIAFLLLAAVACGSTPAASPNPSEPIAILDQMTTADLTHGSPQPSLPTGSPLQRLTFDGVDYIYTGYAELPIGEGTVFVIDGIEINLDVLEMVGTTHEGNTSGIRDGIMVYRLKTAGTNDVYIFRRGKDHVNPEDGQIFKGRDAWIRWTPG